MRLFLNLEQRKQKKKKSNIYGYESELLQLWRWGSLGWPSFVRWGRTPQCITITLWMRERESSAARSSGVVTYTSRHMAQLSSVPEPNKCIDSSAAHRIIKAPWHGVCSTLKLVNCGNRAALCSREKLIQSVGQNNSDCVVVSWS